MGRKKAKKGDSWDDSWFEAGSTCKPSALPPQRLSLGVGRPVVPPGVELEQAAHIETEVHVLLEDSFSSAMISATPVLTPEECAAWITWGETTGFVLEKHAQTGYIAHRDNGRLSVDSDEIAAALFERLRPWVPTEVAGLRATRCNPNIRLYRYTEGQRFGKHVDQANQLKDGSTTEFTVLVYLNDEGLVGGETLFYDGHGARAPEAVRFAPRAGAALVHAHGDRCLTHEASAVTSGVKYVLRSDLAFVR